MYGSWRNAMSRVARPIFITTGWKARGHTYAYGKQKMYMYVPSGMILPV
ncbi:hypothetical protein [Peribacillus butanolivorans]